MRSPHSSTEELANALIHGLGLLAAGSGGAVLITLAALRGDAWRIVGASIFVAGLTLLYCASTLYHTARFDIAKARLKVLDHCAIYFLIASTYTPFTLVGLRGAWGWTLFGLIWGLALAGVVFKFFFTGRFRLASTLIYVAMGWLVLIAVGPLVRALHISALLWLLLGGVAYTVGTLFYMSRRLRYAHAIWHLFVLGGSVCHFVAVFLHVVPGRAS
jgi:hemolysin III